MGNKITISNTISEKPSGVTGHIRYNNINNEFEGYGQSSWGSLGGVMTKIIATYADDDNNPDELHMDVNSSRVYNNKK